MKNTNKYVEQTSSLLLLLYVELQIKTQQWNIN